MKRSRRRVGWGFADEGHHGDTRGGGSAFRVPSPKPDRLARLGSLTPGCVRVTPGFVTTEIRFADSEKALTPLDPELLAILVCPETHQPLVAAEEPLVAHVNRLAEAGAVSNRGGAAVAPGLEALLLRDDGRVAYPVREEIPIMLIDESIDVAALPGPADVDAPTP